MGTSPLSEELCARHGVVHITAVDISENAVKAAERRNKGRNPHLRFLAADCRRMEALKDRSFDVAIDKATMDAIACGGNRSIEEYFSEVCRVLRPGGVFLIVSG